MKTAFNDYTLIPFSGHNLVLLHGLDDKDAANDLALEEIMKQN